MTHIITADVLAWAETYDGPMLHALAFGTLDLGICLAMTSITKGNEIGKAVRFFVSSHPEHSKRYDMVNGFGGQSADLASVVVTVTRLAFLRLPIGTAVVRLAANKLRMLFSDTVSVATGTSTVLTRTLTLLQPAFVPLECNTTANTCKLSSSLARRFSYSGILTFWRTVLAAPPDRSRCHSFKLFPTAETSQLCTIERRNVGGWATYVALISTLNRAVLRAIESIAPDLKCLIAVLAHYGFHADIIR